MAATKSSKVKAAARIDIGDLNVAVLKSVERALGAQGLRKFPGRIIIGIIYEPQSLTGAPGAK